MTDEADGRSRVAQAANEHLTPDQAELYISKVRRGCLLSSCVESSSAASPVVQLGGSPVALDSPWPSNRSKPLDFLASIDLAALAGTEIGLGLPRSGFLSFFYDSSAQPWGTYLADQGSWSVVFTPDRSSELTSVPSGVRVFEEQHLAPRVQLTFPSFEDPCIRSILQPDYSGLKALGGLYADLGELAASASGPVHQIGGWPNYMQAPFWRDCELGLRGVEPLGSDGQRLASDSAFLDGLDEWRLLLQLDSDEDGSRWDWARGGVLYFSIRRSDLAARRFDRVWLSLQTS